MLDSSSHSINRKELSDSEEQDVDNLEFVSLESAEEVALASVNLIRKDMRDNHPTECLERVAISYILILHFSSEEFSLFFHYIIV